MRKQKRPIEEAYLPLMEHIKALRKVLVFAAYAVALGSIVGWFVSDQTFAYLAQPITNLGSVTFITTTPMEPMLVKVKVAIIVGVTLALPVILWQIWSFVLPALKQNERKYLYLVVPSSIILFLAGASLCFFVILPVGIKFLMFASSAGVASTPFVTKTSYIGFIMAFLLTFGLVFQLPIVLLILIRIGILTPKTLAKKRRWAVLIIIIIAALVSPTPDIPTQLMMAGPMYLLYEISIWLGYLVARRKEKSLAME